MANPYSPTPPPPPPAKKRSKFTLFLLFVLGFALLTFLLDAMGIDVIGTRENDTMIERPHNAD